MDRVVWIAASPRGDSDDVRPVVSAALEVGFDEIVLFKSDASIQRLGRLYPIHLKGSTFFLGEDAVGRHVMTCYEKVEELVSALRGAPTLQMFRATRWVDCV